jgi:hypothetical protein
MDSSRAKFQQKEENAYGDISDKWTILQIFKSLHTAD